MVALLGTPPCHSTPDCLCQFTMDSRGVTDMAHVCYTVAPRRSSWRPLLGPNWQTIAHAFCSLSHSNFESDVLPPSDGELRLEHTVHVPAGLRRIHRCLPLPGAKP